MAAPSANGSFIVVTGGDPIDPAHLYDLPDGACVIAADSGVDHARALGLHVDVAVGDFDSVSPQALDAAVAHGALIEQHPAAKDQTDLELALDAAITRGATRIHVLGGHGGRVDHFLANTLLLASPRYASVRLVAQLGAARVAVVRGAATLHGQPGDLVTLLAAHGPAIGVTTEGLRYALRDDDLLAGSTRGISNLLLGTEAHVTLRSGVLLAVQPAYIQPPHHRTPIR